ncbi:uncharacterized protein FA14DRAFT_122938 [Meira miltonrushii]|uniref:Fumarylacetoacetase-like C-terminal domain-containing protein n=1 Tax=Meira miltonrushii TaxID=1280837 RepID=A0A316VCJ9_9BASI|nr:uncharacterized protein FA14DRAFT_122938 [Meira miltonrushii]PWN34848.1 hypothetical protein FA14DRAFT_122938 [Meira miltonrushii]
MASTFRTTGRKIVAIGRNYADHAKELNNAIPKEPFFFLKPTSSYLDNGGTVEIPKGIDCHFEVELGVVIGKRGRDIKPEDAHKHIGGYALAIDLTARNLQEQVKKQGLPWSAVKGFDTFCPVSTFIERSQIPDPQNVRLWLKTDDQMRQDGNSKDMIFPVSRLLQHVSSIMTVEEGDLLLTGTPKGVGSVKAGQKIHAGLEVEGQGLITELLLKVKDREGGYAFQA